MAHVHRRSLIAIAAAVCLPGCNVAPNAAGQISERIGKLANDPASRELDLSRLTSFGWDRLHLFKAGTTRDELCTFLNADRNTCGRVVRYEVVPAAHVAMLFTLGHRLTHIELHALANGVFDFDLHAGPLAKPACVFKVRHSPGPPAVSYLEPRSPAA